MDRAKIRARGLTPHERAERCITPDDVFGLDTPEVVAQRVALLRARIVDAIEAGRLDGGGS